MTETSGPVGSEDLVTAAEIGRRLGLSRQRVSKLAERPDFPAPLGRLGNYRVYRWADINHWNHEIRGATPRTQQP